MCGGSLRKIAGLSCFNSHPAAHAASSFLVGCEAATARPYYRSGRRSMLSSAALAADPFVRCVTRLFADHGGNLSKRAVPEPDCSNCNLSRFDEFHRRAISRSCLQPGMRTAHKQHAFVRRLPAWREHRDPTGRSGERAKATDCPDLFSLRSERSDLGRVGHFGRLCRVVPLLAMTGKAVARLPCAIRPARLPTTEIACLRKAPLDPR